MGIEIERKFLLSSDAWRSQVSRSQRMVQGYLVTAAAVTSGAAKSSVRVRVAGDQAWLNIKSSTLGVERLEFEYAVPLVDAETLLARLCDGVVEKIRHYVAHAGHEFEVDEFFGDNDGLVVAELELNSVNESFEKPDWLGREVTSHARYYNLNLVKHPYAAWSAAEREGQD
ncbi:CYTH domain-containing protein [Tahibacter amnicola]|uniref:CYTH domain-containing protein n=1 Tax=Tahibacter amnicola TaxID=2976241 RepID=A0ABY6BM85_9GAMM|nr:CYTH domain-containing protein [Tahibacter amnicola]UXI69671.1 CYTH domain-containing protein [Tahibacter amnicola]